MCVNNVRAYLKHKICFTYTYIAGNATNRGVLLSEAAAQWL